MKLKIHTQILIAVILAAAFGTLLWQTSSHIDQNSEPFDPALRTWLKSALGPAFEKLDPINQKILTFLQAVGDLFIRLLKMIIIPLILASMVTGIASIKNIKSLGRIGLKTFIYYTVTTLLAVVLGLVLVNIIQPGKAMRLNSLPPAESTQQNESDQPDTKTETETPTPSILSLFGDMIPSNIFAAMSQGSALPIIFFALLLGVAISTVGPPAEPLANFFSALNSVMLKITDWIMKLAPIGVFALMTAMLAKLGLSAVTALARYMTTVLLGLTIHAFVTLPLLLIIFAKYSPLKFISKTYIAVATAFSTASSAATFPITMDCLEKNVGVSNKVASFVLPIGATINMDGTALYEAVAAMFIAQAYNIHLNIYQQFVIMLTAALASVGAAAIPGAGLITMAIVLKAVGLPLEGIAMVLAVDRILDMCRTAVNTFGDACGAAIIANLEKETLK